MLNIRTKPLIIRARLADIAGEIGRLNAVPDVRRLSSWHSTNRALQCERERLLIILGIQEAYHAPTNRTTIH